VSVAYVDTSYLVAIAFGEAGATAARRRMERFDELVSSNLLEAELRAAFHREDATYDPSLTAGLSWIMPDLPLGHQMERALTAGYLRGADLWHVASALDLVESPDELTFLTLDERQRDVVRALGFAV
jgi:hypothetical protein